MTDRFESRAHLAAKIESEGGVLETVEYGVKAKEMPDDELETLWADLDAKYAAVAPVAEKINELLEDWL